MGRLSEELSGELDLGEELELIEGEPSDGDLEEARRLPPGVRRVDVMGIIGKHSASPGVPADVKKRHKDTALKVAKILREAATKANEAISLLETKDKASKVLDPRKQASLHSAAATIGNLSDFAKSNATIYER